MAAAAVVGSLTMGRGKFSGDIAVYVAKIVERSRRLNHALNAARGVTQIPMQVEEGLREYIEGYAPSIRSQTNHVAPARPREIEYVAKWALYLSAGCCRMSSFT